MTLFLNAEELSKSYGAKKLFEGVSLALFRGDRLGLIGPNGSGKSTFLKILAEIETPDEGRVVTPRDLKIGYVPQFTVYGQNTAENVLLKTLEGASYLDEHERQTQARIVLGKAGFDDPEISVSTLSGGWKKRLDIANALVWEPDLLLLDEPTNHLDIEGLLWLENFLQRSNLTYIITSHDRAFLEKVSSRVMEIDRCYPQGYLVVNGSYSNFLEKRADFLESQRQYQSSLSSKVRREIEWLRQTPQARTTKSSSRIQEANRLIDELAGVKSRNISEQAKIDFSSTGRKTKKLLVAKGLAKTLGGKELFNGLSLTLMPGMRVAVLGSNGTGKTTLMKILAGEVVADRGALTYAEGLRIVYFDQHREALPEDISVKEALAPTGDYVVFGGRSIHVNSWGKRFLFSSERLEMPVSHLSGGEKARILIARLMTKPADILFLDEPTNDLDINTLEILEENLRCFPGAVVFITHDRYMLSDVANLFVGLGHGSEDYLFASYYQWENYRKEHDKPIKAESPQKIPSKPKSKKGLSYKEKLELKNIEATIAEAEGMVEDCQQQLEDPKIAGDSQGLQEACKHLKEAQDRLEELYQRWQDLEDRI
ncbi:MAG: ABC-F family ATP-binding cassette domain-containing protein [Chlamydiota bacterium]